MLNQDLNSQKSRMDKQEIARFYWNLPNGAKGRFVAVCTLEMGGSPSSWQHKFLRWYSGRERRPITPLEAEKLQEIIQSERWKYTTERNVI